VTERTGADVALLTERRYVGPAAAEGDWYLGNILREDGLLQAALADLGLSSVRVDWADPQIDWSRFRCAVFRTTWDYFDRFAEFSAWLRRVERQTRLCNDASLVWWNVDKHYLADLDARGVPAVPSRFVERGGAQTLPELLDEAGWRDAVLKPCVSGAARHTYRIDRDNAAQVEAVVRPLLAEESFILQPFQPDVLVNGEDTLMVFEGRYSHAVRKLPKAGDFRVQDDYGGSVHPRRPTDEQVELAERAMAACNQLPAYGRVDMVRDESGRYVVMELELVEPELWLRDHPPAAAAFAEAIARAVTRSK
jgi:glutathione synthase/RimK-type ligase-like ATP-grasp enzyme